MNDCDRALALMSAKIDGEIDAAGQRALEDHLQICSSCRDEFDVTRQQHETMQETFSAVRADAERVAALAIDRVQAMPKHGSAGRAPIGSAGLFVAVGAAAAAGFLLAVLILKPWSAPVVEPEQAVAVDVDADVNVQETGTPLGRLALATGTVQALERGASQWRELRAEETLTVGARVRTSPESRCEIIANDGSALRLGRDTEVALDGGREFALARGRLWSSVVENASAFRVHVPAAGLAVVALGTRFEVDVDGTDAAVTVVEGRARLESEHWQDDEVPELKAGERARIEKNRIVARERIGDLHRAMHWMDEILIHKGDGNPELRSRIDGILAELGRTKATFLLENELRTLGDSCVPPLLAYVRSSEGESRSRRRFAMRIAADVATSRHVPALLELLQDKDADVRFYCASALARTTARTGAPTPKFWRDKKRAEVRGAYREWIKWFEKHRERYPAGNWKHDWE